MRLSPSLLLQKGATVRTERCAPKCNACKKVKVPPSEEATPSRLWLASRTPPRQHQTDELQQLYHMPIRLAQGSNGQHCVHQRLAALQRSTHAPIKFDVYQICRTRNNSKRQNHRHHLQLKKRERTVEEAGLYHGELIIVQAPGQAKE